MYCKNCEKEFKKGKFCPKCGEKLIDNDEYEEELEEEKLDDEEEDEEDADDDNEYDETVRQVKEKAMKAAGVAISFGKALTKYAKKATDDFIENTQNGNLQKSIENKLEKLANGGESAKKPIETTEDYDSLKRKLLSLKEMKDEGLLSTEEYEGKRNILLNKGKPTQKKEKKEIKREDKINKCPNCGEIVNAFDLTCPSCGFELRGKKISYKLDDFSEKMDNIDAEFEDEEDNNTGFDIFGTAAKKRKAKTSEATRKKVEYIKNTPIPNTKEDIIEFMLLASSNIDINILGKGECPNEMDADDFVNQKLMSQAWISKMEQAYQKAEILLKDDSSFGQIKKLYEEKVKGVKSAKVKSIFSNGMTIRLLLMFAPITMFAGIAYLPHMMDEAKLNKIVKEINIDMQNKRYDDALMKANQLRTSCGWSSDCEKKWNAQREELIDIINKVKR